MFANYFFFNFPNKFSISTGNIRVPNIISKNILRSMNGKYGPVFIKIMYIVLIIIKTINAYNEESKCNKVYKSSAIISFGECYRYI